MFGRDPFENMFGVPRQPASLTDGRPTHGSGQRVSQRANMSIDKFTTIDVRHSILSLSVCRLCSSGYFIHLSSIYNCLHTQCSDMYAYAS